MVLRSPKETKEGKWSSELRGVASCCASPQTGIPFEERLKSLGVELKKRKINIVQVNIGNLCNMSCRHCHHSASRKGKLMPNEILHKISELLKKNPGLSLDLTGGAPELHPYILPFLKEVKEFFREIWFHSNLTALADKPDLMEELAKLGVKIIASFPSLDKREAESIRGNGFYAKALEVLKSLNELDKLMCLDLITIGPDGMVYDCDFNLALNLPVDGKFSVDSLLTYGLEVLQDKHIKVGNHCYVYTAQFGTSCFGCLC